MLIGILTDIPCLEQHEKRKWTQGWSFSRINWVPWNMNTQTRHFHRDSSAGESKEPNF